MTSQEIYESIQKAAKLADERKRKRAPNTETAAMREAARDAMDSECERRKGGWRPTHPVEWLPVVPDEHLAALQAEFKRRPGLRAAARLTADMEPGKRDADAVTRALWEVGGEGKPESDPKG